MTSMRADPTGLKGIGNRAQFMRMKNVTLSADADLIEKGRHIARSQGETLNAAFRKWLLQYTARGGSGREVDSLMKRLHYVKAGHHFTRDEMNERNEHSS